MYLWVSVSNGTEELWVHFVMRIETGRIIFAPFFALGLGALKVEEEDRALK